MITSEEFKNIRKHNSSMVNYVGYGRYIFYDRNEIMIYDPKNKNESLVYKCTTGFCTIDGKRQLAVLIGHPINKWFKILEQYTEQREYKGYNIFAYHVMIDFEYYGTTASEQ